MPAASDDGGRPLHACHHRRFVQVIATSPQLERISGSTVRKSDRHILRKALGRVLTLMMICMALFGALASRADGSVYTGCHWQRSTVNVYVPAAHKFWGSVRAMQVWNNVRRGQPHFRRVSS